MLKVEDKNKVEDQVEEDVVRLWVRVSSPGTTCRTPSTSSCSTSPPATPTARSIFSTSSGTYSVGVGEKILLKEDAAKTGETEDNMKEDNKGMVTRMILGLEAELVEGRGRGRRRSLLTTRNRISRQTNSFRRSGQLRRCVQC